MTLYVNAYVEELEKKKKKVIAKKEIKKINSRIIKRLASGLLL